MTILTVDSLEYNVGPRWLLAGVGFRVESGERIGLLGRNGEGKSTLLRILAGEIQAEAGSINWQTDCQAALLSQQPVFTETSSVFEIVASGLGELAGLVADYHAVAQRVATDSEPTELAMLGQLQRRLEAAGGWRLEQRVETVISRLQLPADIPVNTLSGGWQRRVALARALVQEPALLLLDEPTNHLDIESIEWLENTVASYPGAVIFITHDRRFLRRLATRIFELDRGALTAWPGDYANYLRRLEERQHEESQHRAKFDKRLDQEEIWVRQGIKARRTRNEGRVRILQAMRAERQARLERQGSVQLAVSGEQSGKLVIEAEHLSKAFSGRTLIRDFSCRILRGDRIGLLGPNGIGKSTLLKLLLGELEPDSGTVRHGTQLQVAYFDQQRAQLRDDLSALDNIADGRDSVYVQGRELHVISYLKRFLFTPERVRSPVSVLSGGERNRLLLARLFARPVNLLVLDEPTNDLDLETLEVLEDILLDYDGTLLLVSHDREFIDQTVTSVLAFEGDAQVCAYVGGYNDWLRQRPASLSETEPRKSKLTPAVERDPPASRKLSYKFQRELEALPARIEALENELSEQQQKVVAPDFYRRQSEVDVKVELDRLQTLQQELETAYQRWEELEAM